MKIKWTGDNIDSRTRWPLSEVTFFVAKLRPVLIACEAFSANRKFVMKCSSRPLCR